MKILLLLTVILFGLFLVLFVKKNNEEKFENNFCDLAGNCWYYDSEFGWDKIWLSRIKPVKANESHLFSDHCRGNCTAEDGNEIII